MDFGKSVRAREDEDLQWLRRLRGEALQENVTPELIESSQEG
jgi:hypothetical protein